MRAYRILLLAGAFTLATLLLGWWGVAIAAVVAGLFLGWQPGGTIDVVLGALLSWSALLAWEATRGPLLALAARLGPVFFVPGPVFLLLPLLYAVLLAWSGAALGGALTSRLRGRRAVPAAPVDDAEPDRVSA